MGGEEGREKKGRERVWEGKGEYRERGEKRKGWGRVGGEGKEVLPEGFHFFSKLEAGLIFLDLGGGEHRVGNLKRMNHRTSCPCSKRKMYEVQEGGHFYSPVFPRSFW